MKRILMVFLSIAIALGVSAAAEFAACDVDYVGNMTVVNCDEWISLRNAPDTDAARIAKVPLGATMTDCIISNENTAFLYGCYSGQWGYALREYLAPVGLTFEAVYVGDMVVSNCDEWVSLRQYPDTDAARIAKVPLGALVTDCIISSENSSFMSCYYNGIPGYILREYLTEAKQESFEPVYIGDMTVVNCDEWVSLRNAPSSSSPRIMKVPLGAAVTDCLIVSDEFVYCWYNGYSGYIMTQYLSANATPEAGMSQSTLMNFGSEVLNVSYNGYTVISRKNYQDGGEILKTVCYGPDGNPVWHYDTLTESATELDMTAAFPGGTAQMPFVMVYNAEAGLTALDLYTGAQQWFLSIHDANLGGSISTATDGLGNMYIGGFYGPDPIAIDMYGTILWRAQPSVEAYWLHDITLTEAGVVATYDCLGNHEQPGWICYDFGTGYELDKAEL